jgi:hypothetical protein
VVLYNARYSHSHEIEAYVSDEGCRIELVYLPAYAPNLNPIDTAAGAPAPSRRR